MTHSQNLILNLFILTSKIVFMAHIFACVWYILALVERSQGNNNWIDEPSNYAESGDISGMYLMSLYFIIITLTTVGYGDIKPVTSYERLFLILFSLFAAGIFGYILNQVGNVLQEISTKKENYKQALS